MNKRFLILGGLIIMASFIASCGWPPSYDFIEKQYQMVYLLENISENTPTTIDYDPSELTNFNIDINIPGLVPGRLGQVAVCSLLFNPQTGGGCQVINARLPHKISFHVIGKSFRPDGSIDYYPPYLLDDGEELNWRNSVDVRYYDNQLLGMDEIWVNTSKKAFEQEYAKTLVPGSEGTTENITFLDLPLITPGFSLRNMSEDTYALFLNTFLFQNLENTTYALAYEEIQWETDEERWSLRTGFPILDEYIDGEHIQTTTEPKSYYYYPLDKENATFNLSTPISIEPGSMYSFEFNYPSHLRIRNQTISGEILVEEENPFVYELPYLEFTEAEPYIDVNEDKIIEFNIKHTMGNLGEPDYINVYYKKEDPDWIPVVPVMAFPTVTANLGQINDAKDISLKIELDYGPNSVEYTIDKIALIQRQVATIDFEISPDPSGEDEDIEFLPNQIYYLNGSAIDSEGEDCSHLSFDLYIDGVYEQPIRLKKTTLENPFEEQGIYSLTIKYNGTPNTTYPSPFVSEIIPIEILPPPIELIGNYTDYGVDEDGDGLYDNLAIEFNVEVNDPGYYFFDGDLKISDTGGHGGYGGTYVDTEYYDYLTEGIHTIPFLFPGSEIYNGASNGPYNFSDIYLHRGGEFNTNWNPGYFTEAYSFDEFDPPKAELVTITRDYGVDEDGDGKFNKLILETEIQVNEPGDYNSNVNLFSQNGENYITQADSGFHYLEEGIHLINLTAEGLEIYDEGENGPYNTEWFEINEWGEGDVFESEFYYETYPYNYTDFDEPGAVIIGNYQDYGVDENGNGKYDYLQIETEVQVKEGGYYRLKGYLYPEDFEDNFEYYYYPEYIFLEEGNTTLNLTYSGEHIAESETDGPYFLTYIYIQEDDFGRIATAYPEYLTDPYDYHEFEGACTIPTENMYITEDTTFCSGNYEIPWGFSVGTSNVQVICEGTRFYSGGERNSVGADIQSVENVSLLGCQFSDYDFAVSLYNTENIAIISNIVRYAAEGISIGGSTNAWIEGNYIMNSDGRGITIYNSPTTRLKANRVWPGPSIDVECFPAESSIVDEGRNICEIENCASFLCHDKVSSCFPEGTKILMADNTEKNIEDIKVGEYVLGKNGKAEIFELESPIREGYYTIILENGNQLKVTDEHPIYSRNNKGEGWSSIIPEETYKDSEMSVNKLTKNSEVLTINGWTKIKDIDYTAKEIQTYNLKDVEGKTFYANGVLVHNKNPYIPSMVLNEPEDPPMDGIQGGDNKNSLSKDQEAFDDDWDPVQRSSEKPTLFSQVKSFWSRLLELISGDDQPTFTSQFVDDDWDPIER